MIISKQTIIQAAVAACVILIFIPTIVHAQPDTLWTRYFNDGNAVNSREECYRLIQTDDGGFLIGGKTHSEAEDLDRQWFEDYYVVKTDSDGVEEWSQGYDVSGRWRHDFLRGIAQAANGQYFAAGASDHGQYANILKIDTNGDSLWSIDYGEGYFYDIKPSLDGNLVVLGYTQEFVEFGGGCDLYIVKIDDDGEVIWRGVYGTGGNDIPFNIETTRDSGYVAVGRVWPSLCLILKVDSDGEQEWMHTFDFIDGEETFFCVNELVDGGYLVGGTIAWDDALLVRFNSEGDTLWARRGIPDFRERIKDIVPAHGGGFVIVGGELFMNNGYDVMRVDDLGEEVWDFNVEFDGSASFNEATSIVALDDDGYLIGGNRYISHEGGFSAGLIRTEPDTVVLPFELETEADYYDFGELDVDSTSVWEFEIYNTGRRYAVIDTLWFEGDTSVFSCPFDLPYRINPEDTCLVPVLFSPSADTSYAAVLIIPYGDRQALRVLLDGNGYVNSVSDEPNVLHEFALYEAYPNPFNSTTTITYGLDKSAPTRLALYDLSGREVMTLFEGYRQSGFYSVILNAGELSSGLYFLRMDASNRIFTNKVILIR